ncbi:hypothetical protein [Halonotius roseus]|uniref:Homing endonuclease LAGLIDADG domain-containing protein n=1 Tax=Halonotius roseus TaxID=2511997 RepID=A0A544QR21_9EURY|nr:hypothetical protein [Halonotius roseus]TQQ81889.1 hypothetical protein EWF95_02825 [Halonotius roseus]
MTESETERPSEPWKYPYVAGLIDGGSNLTVTVKKAEDTRVGYSIVIQLRVSNTDPTMLGFLDEFCSEHGLEPVTRDSGDTFVLSINKRDDLLELLRLVEPYLIDRFPEAEILMNDLLPGLKAGKGSSKEGFYELMEYVDAIRAETNAGSNPKYDQAYFESEWDM